MKSSSLRRSPFAEDNTRTESRTRKKRINRERVFYIFLLVALVVFIGWFVFSDVLFIKGNGQIITGNFDVRFTSDVVIQDFLTSKEDAVDAGTPLFRYVLVDEAARNDQRQMTLDQRKLDAELAWQKDRMALDERIALTKIEWEKKAQLLAETQENAARIRRGVYLDVHTKGELESRERRVAELEADLEALDQRLQYLSGRFRQLQAYQVASGASFYEASPYADTGQVYLAPVSGVIREVYKEPYETVLVSERILSISLRNAEDLFIRVFFDQDGLTYMQEGDVVEVSHANGEKSRGRIHALSTLFAEQTHAARPQQDVMRARVIAEIYPLGEEDRSMWLRLTNMGLTVSKWRF